MSHIPPYVYGLFAALMYWGYKCCFARVMRIERLMLFPGFCIVLSIRAVADLFHMGIVGFGFWLAGAIAGFYPGYWFVRSQSIEADHKNKLIAVPGDWRMPLLIFCIFAVEFFVHYSVEAGWTFSKLVGFKVAAECLLGSIAGMSIGRNLTYFKRYNSACGRDLQMATEAETA